MLDAVTKHRAPLRLLDTIAKRFGAAPCFLFLSLCFGPWFLGLLPCFGSRPVKLHEIRWNSLASKWFAHRGGDDESNREAMHEGFTTGFRGGAKDNNIACD